MQSTAEIFKSLSDETRLRVLVLLQRGGELCVCDLMQTLNMPQSTVSRHLAYLKKHGWLQDRRGGTWMYYMLKQDLDPFLQALLVLIINRLAGTDVCLADWQRFQDYLEKKDSSACAA